MRLGLSFLLRTTCLTGGYVWRGSGQSRGWCRNGGIGGDRGFGQCAEYYAVLQQSHYRLARVRHRIGRNNSISPTGQRFVDPKPRQQHERQRRQREFNCQREYRDRQSEWHSVRRRGTCRCEWAGCNDRGYRQHALHEWEHVAFRQSGQP